MNRRMILLSIIISTILVIYHLYNSYNVGNKIYILTIECSEGGETYPSPGKYVYNSPQTILLNASSSKDYIFSYWIINGSKYTVNPIKIELNGNTSIVAVFNRKLYHIYIDTNIDGLKILLNNSWINTPYIINYSERVTINLYLPNIINENKFILYEKTVIDNIDYRNSSLEISFIKTDVNISIYYTIKKIGKSTLILSNYGKNFYVNGCRRSLPYLLEKNGEISGEKVVYKNETHSYWLAWYTVIYRNNTCKNYIYLYNKSIFVDIDSIRIIKIHYVLGLNKFPYVRKIWFWPPYRYNYTLENLNKTFGKYAWCAHYRIENNTLTFYKFNKAYIYIQGYYQAFADFLLEFDENVSGAYIEFWSTNIPIHFLGGNIATSDVAPLVLNGWNGSIKAYWFTPIVGKKYLIYVGLDGVENLPNYMPGDDKVSYIDYVYFLKTGETKTLPWPDSQGRFGIHFTLAYLKIPEKYFKNFEIYIRVKGVKP